MTSKDIDKFAAMVRKERDYHYGLACGGSTTSLYYMQTELDRIIDGMVQIFMETSKNFSPSSFRNACKLEKK